MPTYEKGDMWKSASLSNLFLITTNAYIKKNGALVMGRGIAQVARDRWPGLDLAFGRAISALPSWRYGLLVSPKWPEAKLGAFQVKRSFRDKASTDLIEFSCKKLNAWCGEHPEARVDVNCPGVGNGCLSVSEVQPILNCWLPEQVHVWTFK